MITVILTAFLVSCVCGISDPEVQHAVEEDTIKLGLHFVYDEKFAEQAIFGENGTFNTYFTVLTNDAQAYFKNHPNLNIRLTLVNSSMLEEKDKLIYVEKRKDRLNAKETLRNLEDVFRWNESLSRDVDAVFLVTGLKLETTASVRTGEWYGLAYPRSICYGNASVGIIHDDGATFNGAHLLALQIALLLGQKDTEVGECPF
uniref:Putative tick metalloprotease 38 n=1 Tax=Amblyomma triste TaxID=251400 RepID=A0A023GDB3_AMBTT